MKVRIRSYARFREIFGEERTIETDDNISPKSVLAALCEEDNKRDVLFAPDGKFHPHITVILNARRLSPEEIEELSLNDGDALVVYPPVSGG